MAEATENKPESLAAYARAWVDAWEQASTDEQDWRNDAKAANEAYKGKGSESAFNIFHSNIETLVPALYNSTPAPDVRRRFMDDDKVAKEVGDLIERALSFTVDNYDYDDVMDRAVRDMSIVSRGIARIRYLPTFKGEAAKQRKIYEEVQTEHVTWESFRRGPAKVWSQVPWVAFEHFLDKNDVQAIIMQGGGEPNLQIKQIGFTYSADSKSQEDAAQRETPRFGGRARVLEIWDKDAREVVFIVPGDGNTSGQCLARIPDPLELEGFFPIPRPMQQVTMTDSLVPVTAYSVYKELIDELAEVSRRINKLIKQMRPRGGYAGVGAEIKLISEADDGELVPLPGAEMFASQGGGVEKAITWFPLEPTILALKQLYEAREAIKQTIYEITGLSDIIRGATQASETATAQQIKTQWGSVRIQRMQAEVQRFARDLFRMKAEVICSQFDLGTLSKITGMKFPPEAEKQQLQQMIQQGQARMQELQATGQQMQEAAAQLQEAAEQGDQQAAMQLEQLQAQGQQVQAEIAQLEQQAQQLPEAEKVLAKPSAEEVEELLRDDATRSYRIDIESDSTIRGDLTRNQEAMKAFLEGTASYAQAMGPLVQEGAMPGPVAVEIYAAFARQFKLGKQAEDALDRWADSAKQQAEGGSPKDAAAEQAQQAEQQKLAIEKQKVDKEGEEKDRRFMLDKERQDVELGVVKKGEERLDRQEGRADQEVELKRDAHEHTKRTSLRELGLKNRAQNHTEESSTREHGLKERAQEHTEKTAGDSMGLERDKFVDAQHARVEADDTLRAEKGLPPREASSTPRPVAQQQQRDDSVGQALQMLADALGGLQQSQGELARVMAAPTKLVKGPDGDKVAVKMMEAA